MARQARTASPPLFFLSMRARASACASFSTVEHAEADGEPLAQRQILEAARAFGADQIVMAGLAANDAAQRDIAVEAVAREMRELDRRRNLECARHGHAFVGDAGAFQLRRRRRAAARRRCARNSAPRPTALASRPCQPPRLPIGWRSDDAQPVAFEADNGVIGVGEQDHLVDAEIDAGSARRCRNRAACPRLAACR